MKKLIWITVGIILVMSCSSLAANESKLDLKWQDITKKILANPASKGGWTEDAKGKIYQSEDGNHIKVVHSEYGEYIVNLPEKSVYKVEDSKKVKMDDPVLIQRDFGTSLVIKMKDYKFRLKFSEAVSGMKHIEGIKGM
jgi:hypothetical protein